jgi:hypothetical protein
MKQKLEVVLGSEHQGFTGARGLSFETDLFSRACHSGSVMGGAVIRISKRPSASFFYCSDA